MATIITLTDDVHNGRFQSPFCDHGLHSQCRGSCLVCALRCVCACHPVEALEEEPPHGLAAEAELQLRELFEEVAS